MEAKDVVKVNSTESANVHYVVLKHATKAFFSKKSTIFEHVKNVVDDVAKHYGRSVDDITLEELLPVLESAIGVAKNKHVRKLSFKDIRKYQGRIKTASTTYDAIYLGSAIYSSATTGPFMLFWHAGKKVAQEPAKRFTLVLSAGIIAIRFFGNLDESQQPVIDDFLPITPTLTLLSEKSLGDIASVLNLKKSSAPLLQGISLKLEELARDKSLTRAWFPENASSYIEVLAFIAKKRNLNIQHQESVFEIERIILIDCFHRILESMPSEERHSVTTSVDLASTFEMATWIKDHLSEFEGSAVKEKVDQLSVVVSLLHFHRVTIGKELQAKYQKTLFLKIGLIGLIFASAFYFAI